MTQTILNTSVGLSDAQLESLISEMNIYLEAHQSLGWFAGSILVVRNGNPVLAKGYGMANLEHQVPNTPKTRFRIGSITKQFTAAAILQLQDRGYLDVRSPVSTYLPEYPEGDRITLHHLLTHTAGIPNLTELPDISEWMRLPTTLQNLIARFRELPLEFEPGEHYRYSNSGYVLLAQIIEAVSGQPHSTYLREHILAPLGMDDTDYEHSAAVIDKLASGYHFTGERYERAEYIDMAITQGSGGLYSTVEDLARWNQFLFGVNRQGNLVLSESAIATMTFPHVSMGSEYPSLFYGYGLIINAQHGNRYIAHNGGLYGFAASLSHIPETDVTIVVLCNLQGANPEWISKDLLAILLGEVYELPTQPTCVEIDPRLCERYVGTYQVIPEFHVNITFESDQLQIQGTGQPMIPLYPASEVEFFARALDFRIIFEPTATGDVPTAMLLQNGEEISAVRIS